ncbi:hypothetical protein GCM10007063_17450 [Lentibacillus kapialis]|uniref:Uncharacterized protein n=1 Tax=Lentibacillus kapialis TaxID=340214 RepID=A0A917PWS1_9BACI|nr:hypothetical protein [Lentibacillus kapialis]GGJ95471.1 hypothetical protein GCM10007063_17450 [Lentibacillus kapialis]
MMDNGEIIFDVPNHEKQKLTIEDLMKEFQNKRGNDFESDRAILG